MSLSHRVNGHLKALFTINKNEGESSVFLWFLPLLDVNSKLKFLGTHLEATFAFSFTQCKYTLMCYMILIFISKAVLWALLM